jgi:hypothetical protein
VDLSLDLAVNQLNDLLEMRDGIFELLHGVRTLDSLRLALEYRVDNVFELLQLGLQILLASFSASRVDPFGRSTELLLECRPDRGDRGTDE